MIARNAFDYTVDRILKQRCVPIAGAGISITSKHALGWEVHNVKWIVATLSNELFRLRFDKYESKKYGTVCKKGCAKPLEQFGYAYDDCILSINSCYFCDVRQATESNKLGHLAELYLWEFSCVNSAYEALIKLLKIDLYKELIPTPAHIYIAKLAREGLLSEILTTNYDCNFEKAYNLITGSENADVIANLDNYRRNGAAFDDVNRLKVYKLNGCAKELDGGADPEKCESILLTERQLQKWRNRQWAADIFRDRLRSKSLIFVGFGSDEPQVHHTVQAVLDEYTDKSISNDEHVLSTPAAPIMAIFDPQPSFHQQQIVNTYAVHHGQPANQGNELIIRGFQPGGTLSADELWGLIYERVIRSLTITALKHSLQPMNASFTSIMPFAQVILHQVISTLENSVKNDVGCLTAMPNWLESLSPALCSNSKENGPFSFLAGSLSKLNCSEVDVYDPINENKALVSELTTLLFLFRDILSPNVEGESEGGLMLTFESLASGISEKKTLHLNADPSFVFSGDKVRVSSGNNHLVLAMGQAGSHVRPSLRRVANKNIEAGSITPKTIVTLGWQHIFYQRPYDGNKDNVVKTIIDAVCSPTNYFYANQSSIKRRTYLREV
ncbi:MULTISPECIES: SIR2 family protein [Halomonadaceae]|uniref:SIR2 family protein n=1 Tax=Vreelandella glaciei TaxID=186761 RepID=A0A7Z0RYJ1_9GAMM|nr:MULTISPECIES: SIR2 family protein [Halomonas]NYS78285.1 SIR2 family protein [Halomonas glaciei]|tara:strand:+ start:1227 stop:3065 length:1839 start_codon:yes stop_codon:yes gene_type:complete